MNEIFDRLLATGNREAFSSADKFRSAAAELGFGKKEIEDAVAVLDTAPLDLEALDMVSGGSNFYMSKKEKDKLSDRVI